jgi:hypothetical protein
VISERSKLRTPLQLDLSVTYKELRCRYTHDVAHYLAEKPEDIIFPQTVDALVDSILEPVMGANKGRRFGKMRDEVELCWKTAKGETCDFGEK